MRSKSRHPKGVVACRARGSFRASFQRHFAAAERCDSRCKKAAFRHTLGMWGTFDRTLRQRGALLVPVRPSSSPRPSSRASTVTCMFSRTYASDCVVDVHAGIAGLFTEPHRCWTSDLDATHRRMASVDEALPLMVPNCGTDAIAATVVCGMKGAL